MTRIVILGFCLAVFSASPFVAQERRPELRPGQPATFSLAAGAVKLFALQMKQDGFAEIAWLANDDLNLTFGIFDASGTALEAGESFESDSALFVAPRDGEYTFAIKFEKTPDITGPQNVYLEYRNVFKLPARAKQKEVRIINGYSVKILSEAGSDDMEGNSVVLIEKGGKLKKIMKQKGSDYAGFSFPENLTGVRTVGEKRLAALIASAPDKTGDGVPDVMIDYFSGGAHCCFSTYFINLGDAAQLKEVINTGNVELTPFAKNPKGGMRFRSNDNAFTYWNISFAGSPLPQVILEFTNGILRPNFDLMKKAPPTLASLKAKARASRQKMDLSAYTEEDVSSFEEAFWSDMLDLIYTGNETLAWQYFDLVWPIQKPGKERFLGDFKKRLALSYYGTRSTAENSSLRSFEAAFQKDIQK